MTTLSEITLNQGLKFQKKQQKIAKNVKSKNLLFEGFTVGTTSLDSKQEIEKTHQLLSQTDNTVINQIKELQALQTKFNTILEQYNGSNSTLITATKRYVQGTDMPSSSGKKVNTNVFVNQMVTDPISNYIGCYADTENRAMTGQSPLSSQYVTYEQCKDNAISAGFKYFGLQDLRDSLGWCSVSNDLAATQQYGLSVNENIKAIWSSGTTGNNNNTIVNPDGRLLVRDENGNVLWSSTGAPAECSWSGNINMDSITATYGGNCHASIGNVTDKTKEIIRQSDNSTTGMATIPVSNDTFGDPSVGCSKSFNVSYQCGNVNKVLNNDNAEGQSILLDCSNEFRSCQFFLNLNNDGNFCLYKGTPQANQGSVWCSQTDGQQQKPNPSWAASKGKGKYGTCYLTNNQILVPGEWVGSEDGSIVLSMQTDGNLVLYTSNSQPNCTKITDAIYGGSLANAVYELDKVGNLGDMGKVGYIDNDYKLAEYPSTMFSIDSTTNMPIINNSASCSKNVDAIDSITWENYAKTGINMSENTICGLEKATQNENIDRDTLKIQLASIADEIVNKITYLESLNVNLNNQMGIDKKVLDQNLRKYQLLSKQYNQYNTSEATNINGILSDSDIVVLQENYSYLFWSILAITIVVITINAIRK